MTFEFYLKSFDEVKFDTQMIMIRILPLKTNIILYIAKLIILCWFVYFNNYIYAYLNVLNL